MNQYKDTTKQTDAPQTRESGRKTRITMDIIQSLFTAALVAGVLLLISYSQSASGKNHLPLGAGVIDNSATTKYSAAKPSRHSLAIFVPKINPTTNRTYNTGAIRHIYTLAQHGIVASYGGFIDLIKDRHGNKSSRLNTVVTSRRPLMGGHKLTKYSGVTRNG